MERVEVTWYIVFTDLDVEPHWVHRFLKKGFYHCYCFRQIGDYIYYANPTTSNIDTKNYQGTSIADLVGELSAKADEPLKVLKFKYPFDFKNRMFNTWNLVPTCVNVVKMFLGIRARAQTPYQLYKYLKSRKDVIPFNY